MIPWRQLSLADLLVMMLGAALFAAAIGFALRPFEMSHRPLAPRPMSLMNSN